jgi:plastocyanin
MKRLFVIVGAVLLLGTGCNQSWPTAETPEAQPSAPAAATVPVDGTPTSTPEAAKPEQKPAAQPAKKPAPKPVYAYITITDTGFFPAGATIKTGTTVIWTNKTQGGHSVESENNLIHSGNIAPGKSFSHTYSSVGSYPFYDGSNTQFKGTIYVK